MSGVSFQIQNGMLIELSQSSTILSVMRSVLHEMTEYIESSDKLLCPAVSLTQVFSNGYHAIHTCTAHTELNQH